MTSTPRWSRHALGDDASGALADVQESLPVRLIATSRSDFETCHAGDQMSAVVERYRPDGFDFIPVMGPAEGGETVVGVLEVAKRSEKAAPDQTVRDVMHSLTEKYLLGADASILAFIRDADKHPFRFVVSGSEINGLVTLSDLQRLPVRAALFAVVTQLEMVMADVIRQRYPDEDVWLKALPDNIRKGIDKRRAKAISDDIEVESLLYSQLSDKAAVIELGWPFAEDRTTSSETFGKDMLAIQKLRNDVAHAKDYASTRKAAENVCECVRKMEAWIATMTSWRSSRK